MEGVGTELAGEVNQVVVGCSDMAEQRDRTLI